MQEKTNPYPECATILENELLTSRIIEAQKSQLLPQSLLLAAGHSEVAILVSRNQQCLFPAWSPSPLPQPLDSYIHHGGTWVANGRGWLSVNWPGCFVYLVV